VAHGPSPTPVGSSGLWCQGTFVARVLLGPHTPTAFLGPVPYIVGFSGLHLVQFSHCRGAKIRCKSLPNLVGGVNLGKISFSPRLYGKLTSKQAQPKWRKTDSCVAHGPSPTPVGSSGLWCQGTFVARVLLGPHTPTAFLGPVTPPHKSRP
jgi:hypothetical protein